MIKCRDCGADNRMGNIFCNGCGARLDMEDAESQIKKSHEGIHSRGVKRAVKFVRTLVALSVLGLVLYVLVGIFLPARIHVERTATEQERDITYAKFEGMLKVNSSQKGVSMSFRFSSREVTLLANRLLGLNNVAAGEGAGGWALQPDEICIELLPSGFARLVLISRTVRNYRVYSVLVGRFETDGGKVTFAVNSAYVGKVRMFGPLVTVVSDRFLALIEDDRFLTGLRGQIKDLDIDRDELVIALKPAASR